MCNRLTTLKTTDNVHIFAQNYYNAAICQIKLIHGRIFYSQKSKMKYLGLLPLYFLLGRIALCTAKAAYMYSRQSFFPGNHLYVCVSVGLWPVGPCVCLVHCGITTHRIRMPFGMVGRTGP